MTTMKRRRVFFTAVGLVLLISCGAVYLLRRTETTINDAYAVEWAADMVIEYMKSHDGAWPRSWDDLREPYKACAQRVGEPWTFEQLRDRVDVNWDVDPVRLANAPDIGAEPPFVVIWLRSGSGSHWEAHEPNRKILDYLRKRKHGR
jgi:hypothetical protein